MKNPKMDDVETNCSFFANTPVSCKPDAEKLSPEMVQKKLYFLLDQLKAMHSQLPETLQMRVSYDLLTELSNVLVKDEIFDIVHSLLEIQNVMETHLKKLREQVERENEIERQEWIGKITDQEELEHLLALLKIKNARKLREIDMKMVHILDQKRKDQQQTMQRAGVPGFFITDDIQEIKLQMYLFDFILRLGRFKYDPNKKNWSLPE